MGADQHSTIPSHLPHINFTRLNWPRRRGYNLTEPYRIFDSVTNSLPQKIHASLPSLEHSASATSLRPKDTPNQHRREMSMSPTMVFPFASGFSLVNSKYLRYVPCDAVLSLIAVPFSLRSSNFLAWVLAKHAPSSCAAPTLDEDSCSLSSRPDRTMFHSRPGTSTVARFAGLQGPSAHNSRGMCDRGSLYGYRRNDCRLVTVTVGT